MTFKAEIRYIRKRIRLWRFRRKMRRIDTDPDGGFVDEWRKLP